MEVIKRDGKREEVKFDKIVHRIKKQCYELDLNFVDFNKVALNVFQGLFDGVTSIELDNLAAESAAGLTSLHPDYSILASRIILSSLHKSTSKSFSQTMDKLFNYVNPRTKKIAPMISDEVNQFIQKNKRRLDSAILYDRDFNIDYFGYRTLEKSYLSKCNEIIVERPQHMYMRVACGIWCGDIEEVLKTYDLLSQGIFTHATPTLFNSGRPRPQLSSCFLLTMADDSIEHIYKILGDTAVISKNAGGIGISISKIRAKGSYINGSNGESNGVVPMLGAFNATARYVDQGGGKRKGAFAIYLEPWHSDVFDFLDLRKNQGKEELRARDLFLGLWIPDLFMKRVNEDLNWTLMSPDECPNLDEVYGEEFVSLYEKYELEGRGSKVIKARDLYAKIQDAQMETGTPYMMYKDSVNSKTNQKNLGTIKQSNLCTEITEFTSEDEHAVCNLASLSLPKFIVDRQVDHQRLYDVTYQVAKNLNQVIDVNYYPTSETKYSNLKHRPIGIGVQGLADLFCLLELPFDSIEAKKINREIFETIYFAALSSSLDSAKKEGYYESFPVSPASQGILQYDMWEERIVEPRDGKMTIVNSTPVQLSGRWDFDSLKKEIVVHGLRNSLLLAPMPTASTSSILGNNECFEPFTTNIYTRRTLSGEFTMVNKYLVKSLIKNNLWNSQMKGRIIGFDGSIQNIPEISQKLKDIYKTVWEIKQRDIIDMSAERGYFICQSQSLNLFFANVNAAKLSSAHIYGWLKGLKTGSYYTRTKSIVGANKGLGIEAIKEVEYTQEESLSCSLDNPEACEACGS